MVVGGVGEAFFHQLLAAAAILPALGAVRLLPGLVEQFLLGMAMDGPAQKGAGALRAHRAGRADALGQSVYPSAPPAQELPRFHHLACRADVIVVRTWFRGAPRRIIFNASSTASLGRVCARDGGVGSASWFSDALAFAIKHPHVLIVSCWRTIQRSADRYVNEAPSGTAHQHQAPHCRWLDRCVDDAARGILLPADLALTRDPSQMTEAINFVADTLMFGGTAPLVAGALPAEGLAWAHSADVCLLYSKLAC